MAPALVAVRQHEAAVVADTALTACKRWSVAPGSQATERELDVLLEESLPAADN